MIDHEEGYREISILASINVRYFSAQINCYYSRYHRIDGRCDCLARPRHRPDKGEGDGLARCRWVGRSGKYTWSKTRSNRRPLVQVDQISLWKEVRAIPGNCYYTMLLRSGQNTQNRVLLIIAEKRALKKRHQRFLYGSLKQLVRFQLECVRWRTRR